MKIGALVMIDALGLRAKWATCSPDRLLKKMHFLKKDAEKYHATQVRGQTGSRNVVKAVTLQFLSDTIVLSVTVKDQKHAETAVVAAASYASRIMQVSLETAFPLAYRGCVSYGEFETLDNFLVGAAVDDAAAGMEAAEGSFVFLLPSAMDHVSSNYRSHKNNPRLIDFDVPLKTGESTRTLVASPFFGNTKGVHPEDMADRLIRTFDAPGPSVRKKLKNSEPFIREAARRLVAVAHLGKTQVTNVASIPIPSELAEGWERP